MGTGALIALYGSLTPYSYNYSFPSYLYKNSSLTFYNSNCSYSFYSSSFCSGFSKPVGLLLPFSSAHFSRKTTLKPDSALMLVISTAGELAMICSHFS